MNPKDEEEKKIIKERRKKKYIEESVTRLENGELIQRCILKNIYDTPEKEKMRLASLKDREESVKKRFKREKKITGENYFPKDKRILLKTNSYSILKRIIQVITSMIEPDEIYMFDPTCTGTGYKYYKDENMIVYQIDKYMTRWDKNRIKEQIDREVIKNVSGMVYDIKDKWKIVIQTRTEWNKKLDEQWKEYSIIQGYMDMINVFVAQKAVYTQFLGKARGFSKFFDRLEKKYL